VTVKVEVPDVVMELGLKLAVEPVGNPAALKPTLPVKPPEGVTDRV
jgi:hypothetical protein